MVDCLMFDVGGYGLHIILHFLKAVPVIADKTNECDLGSYRLIQCHMQFVADMPYIYIYIYIQRIRCFVQF